MEGPQGIDLAAIGPTDRGFLWRASRDREHDRIVRIVDPRFCDERFRHALRNLRQRQHPRMLRIASEGWFGAHYYIEYAIDPPWQTLEERFTECEGWRDRVLLLGPVCDALALWQRSPVHPLGLNLRNIVLVDAAGQRLPWLVPCPAITIPSPCDLFGLDSAVVAAMAPETIRGVLLDERAQDMYALGTLVAQAVSCPEPRSARDDESRIVTQARGALLVSTGAGSTIDAFLRTTPQVEQLFRTIRHYRHTTPAARPHDPAELRSALAAVTDPIAFAEAFRSIDPGRALEMLSLVDGKDPAQRLRAVCLATEIHSKTGDWQASLRCLDEAIALAPIRTDLRWQRCDTRWRVLQKTQGKAAHEEAERLLKELKALKILDPDATMPYKCSAEIHRWNGDLASAAQELYDAIEVAPTDLQALLLYAQCWIDLNDPDKAAAVADTARRRISGMVKAGVITREEGQQWNDKFDDLSG
jgi:hypothetical protein